MTDFIINYVLNPNNVVPALILIVLLIIKELIDATHTKRAKTFGRYFYIVIVPLLIIFFVNLVNRVMTIPR